MLLGRQYRSSTFVLAIIWIAGHFDSCISESVRYQSKNSVRKLPITEEYKSINYFMLWKELNYFYFPSRYTYT